MSLPFCPPPRVRRRPRRGRGESPRSAERNSSLNLSEKTSARTGRTRLRQFVCPGQPVQEKEPPVRVNSPAAVRVPRSASAAKGAARQGRTRLRQFACPGQPVQKRSRPERMNRVRSLCTPAQPVLRKRQLLSGKKERQKKTSAFLYKNTLDIL